MDHKCEPLKWNRKIKNIYRLFMYFLVCLPCDKNCQLYRFVSPITPKRIKNKLYLSQVSHLHKLYIKTLMYSNATLFENFKAIYGCKTFKDYLLQKRLRTNIYDFILLNNILLLMECCFCLGLFYINTPPICYYLGTKIQNKYQGNLI